MSLVGVIAVFGKSYTVSRESDGVLAVGVWTPGATSDFTIVASIQPVTGDDLKLLPEGQHSENTRVVYTTTPLRTTVGETGPDTITYQGEPWKVIRVEGWEAFGAGIGGDHGRVFISKVVNP